jgi:hypothetical protein
MTDTWHDSEFRERPFEDDEPMQNGNGLYPSIPLKDIKPRKSSPWIVSGIIPAGPAFGLFFGLPKTFKSFSVSDLQIHISADKPYGGCKVKQSANFYVTNEGVRGVEYRLMAMRNHHELDGKDDPFEFIPAMPNLTKGDDTKRLIDTIGNRANHWGLPVGTISLDTMRAAMPGGSTSDEKNNSAFLANASLIKDNLGATIIAVHHSPRADEGRASGVNNIDGGCDVMIHSAREEGTRNAAVTINRMKDGDTEGLTWRMTLVPHDIGKAEGERLPACHVELLTEPSYDHLATKARTDAAKHATTLTPIRKQFLDIVVDAIAEHGELTKPSRLIPPGLRAVTRETLRNHARDRGWGVDDPDNLFRANFSKRLNELAGLRLVGLAKQSVWLVPKSNPAS